MRHGKVLSCIVTVGMVFTGCAKELPSRNPQGEMEKALRASEKAEERSDAAYRAAKQERERAEELYSRAKALSDEREKSCRLKCAEVARESAKACVDKKKVTKNNKKAKAGSSEKQAAPTPKKIVDPEYSPSDAPVAQ